MHLLTRRTLLPVVLAPLAPRLSWAQASEIRVISSGGFTAADNILAPLRADDGQEDHHRLWCFDGERAGRHPAATRTRRAD